MAATAPRRSSRIKAQSPKKKAAPAETKTTKKSTGSAKKGSDRPPKKDVTKGAKDAGVKKSTSTKRPKKTSPKKKDSPNKKSSPAKTEAETKRASSSSSNKSAAAKRSSSSHSSSKKQSVSETVLEKGQEALEQGGKIAKNFAHKLSDLTGDLYSGEANKVSTLQALRERKIISRWQAELIADVSI